MTANHRLTVPLAVGLLSVGMLTASAQQYPLLDQLAQRVVQKYQNSSCQQLAAQRAMPKSAQEERAVAMLRQNPGMRQEFINRVAAPIANKLFECGMIP
jgi:hypothetical protein